MVEMTVFVRVFYLVVVWAVHLAGERVLGSDRTLVVKLA